VPVIGATSDWIDHPAMSFPVVPTPLRYTYFEPATANSVVSIESGIDCTRVADPVVLSMRNDCNDEPDVAGFDFAQIEIRPREDRQLLPPFRRVKVDHVV